MKMGQYLKSCLMKIRIKVQIKFNKMLCFLYSILSDEHGEHLKWCAGMQVASLENVWNLLMLFERIQHETLSINESMV